MLRSDIIYYYIGELGTLNISFLGYLDQEFKKFPEKKIKIITYSGFGELLEFIFSKNIEAICPPALERYKAHAFKHKLNINADRIPELAGAINLYEAFSDELKLTNKFRPAVNKYPPRISSPLSGSGLDNGNIINIQSRVGKKVGTDRNIKKNMLFQIVNLCLQESSAQVVVHGLYDKRIRRIDPNRVSFCSSLVDGISYMHKSKLTICAHSGFTAFALNCASNVAVLIPGEFPKSSRDVILSNVFQTYTETIYYKKKTQVFDREKLKITISRAFNENSL